MDITQISKKLLIKEPFYGIFMLGMKKIYTDEIPTLGVYKDGINVMLLINREFLDSLTEEDAIAFLKHELNHVLLKHIFYNDCYPDHTIANYAADCSVNSYIPELQKSPYIYPARFKLPDKESMKFYYGELIREAEKVSGNELADDHSKWDSFSDLTETEKKLIDSQINSQAKSTAEYCKKSMPGTIPGHLKEYIDSLFEINPPSFNWKKYFRRVIGNSIKTFIKSTRYRPSFRFKGSPGNIVKFRPKILVAIDTSGSVSDAELEEFFSEIYHIYKSGVDIEVVEFDTRITHKFIYKGSQHKFQINGRGGTDVTEVMDYYNKSSQFSSLVVFTDGYLGINYQARNLIWVITPNGSHQNYPGISIYMNKNNN